MLLKFFALDEVTEKLHILKKGVHRQGETLHMPVYNIIFRKEQRFKCDNVHFQGGMDPNLFITYTHVSQRLLIIIAIVST